MGVEEEMETGRGTALSASMGPGTGGGSQWAASMDRSLEWEEAWRWGAFSRPVWVE